MQKDFENEMIKRDQKDQFGSEWWKVMIRNESKWRENSRMIKMMNERRWSITEFKFRKEK